MLGTLEHHVDRLIVLSEFARDLYMNAGLPEHKLVVKRNFIRPPQVETGEEPHFLFIGRLSEEKGLSTLMAAWSELDIPLRIIGDGPMRSAVQAWADGHGGVEYLGPLPHQQCMQQLARARALVIPSVGFEGSPMTIIEAMALGKPVVASAIGGIAEMVSDGQSGLLFEAGSAPALTNAIRSANAKPDTARGWGDAGKQLYEGEYSPQRGYEALMAVYEEVQSD
jgi:glycosyltransferase involved in cell wall biosynthesis